MKNTYNHHIRSMTCSTVIGVLALAIGGACIPGWTAEETPVAATKVPAGALGLPGALAIDGIRAEGTLHRVAQASYAKQLAGHGGSDWDNKKIPGDGTGRWIQGLCLLGAYFHEKPTKMTDEIQRMLKMRNPHGDFGPDYGINSIRGGAWFDNNHVLNWALDYAQYYDAKFGLEFAKEFAQAAFLSREAAVSPGPRKPGSKWISWGETGSDFGALQSVSRLAMVTKDPSYARFLKLYADGGLDFKNARGHAHGTCNGMIGWVLAYHATGEKKYLDHVLHFLETVALPNQTSVMGFPDYSSDSYTEGCAVADWMMLNLHLGQATQQTKFFDRAERILWNSFLHHMDNRGSMGCGNSAHSVQLRGGGLIPHCCDMHGAKGIAYALMHSLLTDDQGLSLVLYHPFTAAAPLPGGKSVRLTVTTDYPQDGKIAIRIADCTTKGSWRLHLRVPAWSKIVALAVNGTQQEAKPTDGWLDLVREWKTGDEVRLDIPMTVWLAKPNSETPIPLPTENGQTVRAVRIFRGPMLMSAAQACNEHLDAAIFAKEKQTNMTKIKWDTFVSPLIIEFGTVEKPPAYAPLTQPVGRFPFFAADNARIPALIVAKRQPFVPASAEATEDKHPLEGKVDIENFKPIMPKLEDGKKPAPDKSKPEYQMAPYRQPVLLVPCADDRAKTGSKIVVFDVVVGK